MWLKLGDHAKNKYGPETRRDLAEAREHMVSTRRAIFRQRELITLLQRDGEDTEEARRRLASFEDVQKMDEAEHERLLRELDELTLKTIGQATRAPDVEINLANGSILPRQKT